MKRSLLQSDIPNACSRPLHPSAPWQTLDPRLADKLDDQRVAKRVDLRGDELGEAWREVSAERVGLKDGF